MHAAARRCGTGRGHGPSRGHASGPRLVSIVVVVWTLAAGQPIRAALVHRIHYITLPYRGPPRRHGLGQPQLSSAPTHLFIRFHTLAGSLRQLSPLAGRLLSPSLPQSLPVFVSPALHISTSPHRLHIPHPNLPSSRTTPPLARCSTRLLPASCPPTELRRPLPLLPLLLPRSCRPSAAF